MDHPVSITTSTASPPSPPLVERAAELDALDRAIDHPGQLVVIEGVAGIGKSSLVRRAVSRAGERGLQVLVATGLPHEQAVVLGVASRLLIPALAVLPAAERRQLLDGVPDAARAVVAGRPLEPSQSGGTAPGASGSGPSTGASRAADPAAGSGIEPGDGGDQGATAAMHGLLGLLERLVVTSGVGRQGVRPALLAVDDAQWSDDTSLRLLTALVARLPGLPVTVVVAVRADEPATSPLLDGLRGAADAVLLRPGALSPAGVAEVVRHRHADATDRFVAACHGACGGNPFFLTSLLDELAAEHIRPDDAGSDMVARVVPTTAGRSVLARLGRLTPAAGALARALAVLGDGTDLTLAAQLADLSPVEADGAADELAAAGLLRRGHPLAFVHSLVGSIVVADLPVFARARAHRRAAEILSDAGAPAAVVASHLADLPSRGDPWVASRLHAAADEAAEAGEHHSAARLLDRAVREPPADGVRAAVARSAALAAARAGWPDADRALRTALHGLDPSDPRRRPVVVALARLLVGKGDFATAADEIDTARRHLGSDVELDALWLMATGRAATRRSDALEAFDGLLRAARAGVLPDDRRVAARLATRAASAGEDPAVVRRLAEAALAEDPLVAANDHGIAFAFLLAGILWIEEPEWCMQAATAGRRAAEHRGSPLAIMAASHWQALAAARLGRLDEALVHADRALLVSADGWRALAGWTHAACARVHLERDDLGAAHRHVARGETVPRDMLDWAFVAESRGWLALAEDRPDDALADARDAGCHLAEVYRIDHPGVLPWRSLAVRAAHRLGHAAEARALAEEQLERARALGLDRPLADALRTVAVVRGGDAGLAALDEAVELLRCSPALVDRAHALVHRGSALRRAGRTTAARPELGRGLRLAELVGAARVAAVASDELRSAGGRRRAATARSSAADLTATQLRVAELAALGLTNAQIAARLYLAAKTVEWHLGAVYRQMGIRRRTELADALGSLRAVDGPG